MGEGLACLGAACSRAASRRGKRFYERPGRVASGCLQDASTPESGVRGAAPGEELPCGLGTRRRPAWCPAKRGRDQDGGGAGRRPARSESQAGGGRAAATVYGREDAAPSSCGGLRNGRAPRASILCRLAREQGRSTLMALGPRVPDSGQPRRVRAWPSCLRSEKMKFSDLLIADGTWFSILIQAFHGIQQQRCCNGQRHLRITHIPRFQQNPAA